MWFCVMHTIVILLLALFRFAMCTKNEEGAYISADGIKCLKCGPGYKLVNDCNHPGHSAQCIPCEEGTFQDNSSMSPECIHCAKNCEKFAVIKKKCTQISDLQCDCLPGYYKVVHDEIRYHCKPHKKCYPGQGVIKQGTNREDVDCAPCPNGTFSSVLSSTMPCHPYTQCGRGFVSFGGNELKDVRCFPIHSTTVLPTKTSLPAADIITANTCEDIFLPNQFTHIKVSDRKHEYKAGDSLTLVCDEGYIIYGKSNFQCQINGKWDGSPVPCIFKNKDTKELHSLILMGLVGVSLFQIVILAIACYFSRKRKKRTELAERKPTTDCPEEHIYEELHFDKPSEDSYMIL